MIKMLEKNLFRKLCKGVFTGVVFLFVAFGTADDIAGEPLAFPDMVTKMARDISLDLRDMDVVDVYKFLAMRGGFNASISKEIAGRVTLYLRNVSIGDALEIISVANNLAYKVIGGNTVYVMTEAEYQRMYGVQFSDRKEVKILRLNYIKPAYALEALRNLKTDIGKIVIDEDTGSVVMIDTPDKIKQMEEVISSIDVPLELYVYDLKYADANDVASKLREKLDTMAVGSVQADTRSNQLIVKAFPGRINEVSEVIKALDTKTKAVLIEVRILKVNLRPGFDMGIDWKVMFKQLNNLAIAGSFAISDPLRKATAIAQIAQGNMGVSDFAFDLKMLKEVASTRVIANPRLMVTNKEEARIHIGDKLAYVTTTTIGTGDSQRVNEEIHYIDVGVKFVVTPVINDDGFITMKIRPEISSKSGELETPQGARVPLINLTELETSILVKDGNTIIIAGLRQDEATDGKSGIPWLMDLPYVGHAFSDTSKRGIVTEIVLLLTPHIVTGEENFVDVEGEKTSIEGEYKTYGENSQEKELNVADGL
jgi:type II secretory pathway component GspD/PulD (secretin)